MLDILLFVLLSTADPAEMLGSPWAQYGITGVVVFMVLKDNRERERRMTEILRQQFDWTQKTLLEALNRSSSAIEKITAMEIDKKNDCTVR